MPPAQFLDRLRYHLGDKATFTDGPHMARRLAPAAVPETQPVVVFQDPSANPSDLWTVTCDVHGGGTWRVLITKATDRRPAWGRGQSLALALAEHDILVGPDERPVADWRFPGWCPLGAVLNPTRGCVGTGGSDRFDPPVDERVSAGDRLLLGPLGPRYRRWVGQVRAWAADDADAAGRRLFSLANALHHETWSVFRPVVRRTLDRLVAMSYLAESRLLFGVAADGWYAWAARHNRRGD